MKTARSIAAALPSAPTRSLRTTLVRRVPLSPLIKTGTVDYLFMSGRPSRFNTAGVKCVYFAEDDPTPSEADIRVTRDLIRAGQLLKIEVLDHVILGRRTEDRPRDYVSLRECGYFT